MADRRELILGVRVDDKGSRPLRQIGDAADDAKDDLQQMDLGLRKLDTSIASTERTLAGLRAEISRTGDLDLLKDVTKQEQRLKALTRQRKSLVGDLVPRAEAEEAGATVAARMGQSILQTLPRALSAGGGAGGVLAVPIAASIAAGLGATATAGVLAGAAGGAIAVGIKIAAKDPRVQGAAKTLASQVGDQFREAAGPFVPAIVSALGTVRTAIADIDGDLQATFGAAARYVEPLARGVGDLVRRVGPGIRQAVEAAGPIIRELADGLPRIGDAISDVLRDLSGDADTGASAVRGLVMAAESGIRIIGGLVGILADMYRTLVQVGQAGATVADTLGGWIPGLGDLIGNNKAKMDELAAALDRTGVAGAESGAQASGGVRQVATAAAGAKVQVESLSASIDRLSGANLDAERANIALEAAIDDAAAAASRGKRGIDENTEAGRSNRSALIGIADAARQARDAAIASGRGQDAASAAMERGRSRFLATAAAMRVGKAEAEALANQLFGLPPGKRITISVNDGPALAAIARVQRAAGAIRDIRRGIYYTVKGDLKLPGGTSIKGAATGGPIEGPGPKGVDSELRMLAPGEHVLTAREVDAAGGHRAIEDWRRQLRAGVSAPAVASGGGARGGGGQAVIRVQPTGFAGLEQVFVQWLMQAIRATGGNPSALGVGGTW